MSILRLIYSCFYTINLLKSIYYLGPTPRPDYKELFYILSDQLPDIAAGMENIEIVYINEKVAKYRIRKDEVIDGQNYRVTYYIHFIKDGYGLWFIDSF